MIRGSRTVLCSIILGGFSLFTCAQSGPGARGLATKLSSRDYIQVNEGLNNFFYRVKEGKATVAFLGGSITNMEGWRNRVCDQLRQDYPETDFTFIEAGIPSLGSLPHAFRLPHDVLAKGRIDLLFVESAVNDKGNGTPVLTQRRALEGIVLQAKRSNPAMDIVLMAFVDPYKMQDYRKGKVPDEVAVHEAIARHYRLPFINLAKEVTDRIDAGEFTWEDDFKNLHPSPFGHRLYAHTIHTLMQMEAMRGDSIMLSPVIEELEPGNYREGHYLSIDKARKLRRFELVQNWEPGGWTGDKESGRALPDLPTREGYVHIPVLEATGAGASFRLKFKGPVIGIGMISGPDAGMLEYKIDGKSYTLIDLYTRHSGNLYLPRYLLLADELGPGQHRLEVRISPKHHERSLGTAARIAYFLEN